MRHLFSLILLIIPFHILSAQEAKLPIPSTEAQAKAETEIRSIFKEDLKKKDRASKAALATKLMDLAKDKTNTAASRYVLLLEAKNVAVEALEFEVAFQAIDQLYTAYELPFPILTGATFTVALNAHKVDILNAGRKKASGASDFNLIAEMYLNIAEDSRKYLEYEDAVSSAELAAKTAKDPELQLQARRLIQEISSDREELSKIKKAQATLNTNPDDSDASEVVGSYQFFVKGDWKGGSQKLLKSSDSLIRNAAQKELDVPAKVDAQIEAGEAWAKAADREKNLIQKRRYQDRAYYWYGKVLATANGLDRIKVQNKIKELRNGAEPDARGLLAHWKFTEGAGTVAMDYSGNGHDANLRGGVTWHSDYSGRGIKLDGATGYVDVKGADAFSLNNPQTIFWRYLITETPPVSAPRGYVILAMANIDASTTTMLSVFPDVLGVGTWAYSTGLLSTPLPAIRQWHSGVYIYDGKEAKLYVDGILKTTSKKSPDKSKVTRFELGRWGGGGTPIHSHFKGLLSDVRVYDRVLSDAEIAMLARLK